MLPRLEPSVTTPLADEFAAALRARRFAGDIAMDYGARTVSATDNSIYQRFPLGVLYPRHTEDVILIAELSREWRFRELSFCPRGGGTSTNGQSLGDGFIVDLSKHMNRILELNVEQGWARVQAGVVKDQLNAAVKQLGLFFAPDLSTSNRATIGGMINTDASGQGSARYGKTRDHVLALRSVLPGGDVWESTPLQQEQLATIFEQDDRWGQIHRVVNDVVREHGELIQRTFPVLNRGLTGYDLAHVKRGEGLFDLNKILCGSEGTLAFVVEATVKLEHLPATTAVIVIEYDDFVTALRDARRLTDLQPTAIETVDATVVDLARGDEIWRSVQAIFSGDGRLAAINLVELSAESDTGLQQQLAQFNRLLGASATDNASRLAHRLVESAEDQAKLWAMRKKAVGLLGNMAGSARPVPFVEDTAVPPENLADFIAAFRALLDARQLHYGMFGHADAGVIHVRPALDMRDDNALATVRDITDRVYALVQDYDGILWGEHGKGVRAEYSPATFGELYPQLQRIKAEFDPFNQMNPGKVATPPDRGELLHIDNVATRGQRDRLIARDVWHRYEEALYCNGNGACFNWKAQSAMCPSWKATRERQYSPKGRAMLFKEWLTLLSRQDYHPARTLPAKGLQNFLPRLRASARKLTGETDFSHQVYRSMDECLACKACASQCPIHVDVPSFRSVFLQHYFSRYLRPLRHHLVANLERTLPLLAKLPWVYNGLSQYRPMSALMSRLTGLTAMPALRGSGLKQGLKALNVQLATPKVMQSLSAAERTRAVILVQDVFTRYFEPELIADTCTLLTRLGFTPLLAPFTPNGKPLHVLGFLERFSRVAERSAKTLNALADSGIPLVGLEPSMTLVYRSEYRQVLGERAPAVLQLGEWLAGQGDYLQTRQALFHPGDVCLLPHCTEATLNETGLKDWQSVFAALGQTLTIAKVGCCGMAGTYGHEVQHQATSKALYQMSWAGVVNGNGLKCATGYSCRAQIKRLADDNVPHPAQALLSRMRDNSKITNTNAAAKPKQSISFAK